MSLTLDDFDVRYGNIRRDYPEIRQCSVVGCKNPRDITLLGIDSSCAYHRLLFDFWLYEVMDNDKAGYYFVNQRAMRSAFTRWRNKTGKDECDAIVLKMAHTPINWEC